MPGMQLAVPVERRVAGWRGGELTHRAYASCIPLSCGCTGCPFVCKRPSSHHPAHPCTPPPPLPQNGIIHNCTHGNNPDVRLTEDEMIVKIFTYLDKLFHIVKPQARCCCTARPALPVDLPRLAPWGAVQSAGR